MKTKGAAESVREQLVSQLGSDFRKAHLHARDSAMLAYAHKLTLSPASIGASDVGRLYDNGFDERAVHDICAITAYFAFVNRIADGLGVELESD